MRFVFLSYNYSPDIHSPQEWVDRIKFYIGSLEWLAKTNTVIRVDQINYTGEFTHNGVKYHFVDDGKKKNYFPKKLHRFVKALRPDVVIVSSFLFPLQVMQLRQALGRKVKIIVQNHADKPFAGIKKYLQRRASGSVDAFVFASQAMGEDWVAKGNIDNKKKIREIVGGSSLFYPLDKTTARSETTIEGDPIFLWVGRLNKNKDPLLVVSTFLEFVNKQPAARLYMIYQNDDLLPEMKKMIEAHKNSASIILVGKIPNDALLYWFNSADFYISASHYEGSGTALGEAMSCGCVPVVTDIFSFRAITNNGDCGLLYEPGNANSLMNILVETIALDKEEKREKCLTHFKNELSFEAIGRKFYEVAASL
jgi:glycosyltransferase involved in cell wall biosynthesis